MGCLELCSSSCAEICAPINWRHVSQGISVDTYRKSSHLSCMLGKRELFCSQCRGIGLNLEWIWATLRYFTFLRWHHFSSRLVRDFWGTLCTSIKQIKAPNLFDWEQGIVMHECRGIGPHLSASGKCDGFSRVAAGSWGMFSSYGGEFIKNFCLFSDVRTPI